MKAILLTLLCLTVSFASQANNYPESAFDSTEVRALRQVKGLLKHLQGYCRSITHAEQVIKRAELLSAEYLDHYLTLTIKMEKGRYYGQRGDYRQALQSFAEGLPYLAPTYPAPPHTRGWFLNELGELLYQQGFYEEAFGKFKQARQFFAAEDFAFGQSVAANNMGLSQLHQGKNVEALRCFKEATRLRQQDSSATPYVTHSKLYQVRALLAMDSARQARALLEALAPLPLDDQQDSYRKMIYQHWGELYRLQGDYKQAQRYLDSALALCQRTYDPLFETRLRESLAQVHLAQGQLTRAEKHAEEGLEKARNHQHNQYRQKLLGLLATINQKQGDIPAQLSYLQNLSEINATLLDHSKKMLKDLLLLREKTQKAATAINNLQTKSAYQQNRLQTQFWIILLGGILILAALAASLFFYRLNRKLRRYRSHLQQYGERSLRAANGLSNVVMAIDEHGRVIFINQAGEDFARRYWGEAPALSSQFLELNKEKSQRRFWQTRLERAQDTHSWQEMSEINTTQGALYFLFTYASIFIEKQYRGVVILGTDVTEQHRRNIDLQQKSAELEKTLETKERMLSILAHDLKEGINSSLELVKVVQDENPAPDNYASYLELLRGNLSKTQALLYKTLDWVRNQGQPKTEAQKFKFYRLAKDLEREFSESFRSKGLRFESNYPADLELTGEPGAIMTVLRNLLSNAIKFSPEKTGWVRLQAEIDSERKTATISIKDNGMGMDKEQLEALLSHQQLPSTQGTRGETGTGMGIKICQQLLAQNQSKLQVISEIGHGSQFIFRLPLA